MVKNLVIVESPAKAKTIEGFLGKEFTVKSSYGHVRDLSKSNLSIDIEKGFIPQYEIPADKKALVAELKKISEGAEMVWLASDEDREGESISWHLYETLGLDDERYRRIVFHEITKPAILNAINNPRKIDMGLVSAQQARRVLDRLVGYELSPLLWKKVKPSLSAGRVQSVAVRLIVEREEEIKISCRQALFALLPCSRLSRTNMNILCLLNLTTDLIQKKRLASSLKNARMLPILLKVWRKNRCPNVRHLLLQHQHYNRKQAENSDSLSAIP